MSDAVIYNRNTSIWNLFETIYREYKRNRKSITHFPTSADKIVEKIHSSDDKDIPSCERFSVCYDLGQYLGN